MSPRQTSIETYMSIKNNGLLSEKRMRVYEIFWEHGDLTGTQVAKLYKDKYPSNSHSETIRNRITELVEMGCLVENGIVPCPINGREVLQFTLTDNEPKPLPKKKTKKQKVNEVLEQITLLGKKLVGEQREELLEIYYQVEQI